MRSTLMGVPVVTLVGDRHASRVSASVLHRVGLKALVGGSPKHYQQLAVELGRQRKCLAELREGMRARLLASPLCDRSRYAREVEAAYRQMWGSWCAKKREPEEITRQTSRSEGQGRGAKKPGRRKLTPAFCG